MPETVFVIAETHLDTPRAYVEDAISNYSPDVYADLIDASATERAAAINEEWENGWTSPHAGEHYRTREDAEAALRDYSSTYRHVLCITKELVGNVLRDFIEEAARE